MEALIVELLLQFFTVDQLNQFFGDPQTVSILVGILISISTGLLGTYLLLRRMSMTSDAISHTVLLGLVLVLLIAIYVFDTIPDLSSPWLIVGAAAASVVTVIATELISNSQLVREDAALGMIYSVMFAIGIILISGLLRNIHFDGEDVIMGEIGLAWADTNAHCVENCAVVVITPDDSRAEMGRRCTNCTPPGTDGIKPRDPEAEFVELCSNCGTYTASEAWAERLIDTPPVQVFWPKSLTSLSVIAVINVLFVMVFYKELKLSTFDSGLAATFGFRPQAIKYALVILVSLTAVGAFEAVGAILVVAFFVIPSAAAYLLTERLSHTLLLSLLIGSISVISGYELARGRLLGVIDIGWDTSISASIALMASFFFALTWLLSPRSGLISMLIRRWHDRQRFADLMLIGYLHDAEATSVDGLSQRLNWAEPRTRRVIRRLRTNHYIDDQFRLTNQGRAQLVQLDHQDI